MQPKNGGTPRQESCAQSQSSPRSASPTSPAKDLSINSVNMQIAAFFKAAPSKAAVKPHVEETLR